jgi:hypothetical protein
MIIKLLVAHCLSFRATFLVVPPAPLVAMLIFLDSGSLKRSCACALKIAWLHIRPLVSCVRTGDCWYWIHESTLLYKKGE